jgi:protein-tyrosine phosphatase
MSESTPMPPVASPGGTILFVCTGNVCRSPYLELMLRNSLAQNHITSIAVRSAGTDALLRQPIAPPMAGILAESGINPLTFRSRQLDRQMVRSADLILTAERSHRSVVARMQPSALPRIFTVRQAARLLQSAPTDSSIDPNDNLASRLAVLIASGRGLNQSSAGEGDDVPDPWQQSLSMYRAVAGMLKEPLDVLTSVLAAHRTAPSL